MDEIAPGYVIGQGSVLYDRLAAVAPVGFPAGTNKFQLAFAAFDLGGAEIAEH